jgi:phosphoribosyl 1,2-cyclic phosphate phosphodiesterase
VLGSGTSFGVPVIGCRCRVCTSSDPRDRRNRTAALLEIGGTRLLVDAPPELRLALVAAQVERVDAVLFTHDHADHVAGLDDLRAFSVRQGSVPVYGPPETLATLRARFGYIFDPGVRAPEGTSKPELRPAPLTAGVQADVAGVGVLPLELDHGGSRVFGYRIGAVAYCTDVKRVPPHAEAALRGVEVLVLNALFDRPHPTHLSLDEAVEVARVVGARRTWLTHLTHRYSHAELESRLPPDVRPAYDGLTITF